MSFWPLHISFLSGRKSVWLCHDLPLMSLYHFFPVMLRKSVRLQEGGYYTEEGTPTVSYKEILYRWAAGVFECTWCVMFVHVLSLLTSVASFRVFPKRRRRSDQNLNRRVSMEADPIQIYMPAERQTPCEEQTGSKRGEASFKNTVLTMSTILLLLLLAFGEWLLLSATIISTTFISAP